MAVQPLDTYIRAVRIELQSSGAAMRRLMPDYQESVRAEELSNLAIGEIGTIIRALASGLDKLGNAAHVHAFGEEGIRTYFPLTTDEGQFSKLLRSNLRGIAEVKPNVAAAFERCQPFHPEFEILALLRPLYRTHAHRGFELHEAIQSLTFEEIDENVTLQEDSVDARSWPGVTVDRTYYTLLGVVSGDLRATMRNDWHFAGTENSVMGTLLELHNVTVKVVGIILKSLEAPFSAVDLAKLSVRAVPAPAKA